MPDYILAYHGGEMPETQEEIDAEMKAWGDWMQKHHAMMKDPGNPVGKSKTITKDGVEDHGGANPLSGYTIITADDMDAAIAMAQECPAVNAGSIEIAPIVEIEM